MNSTPTPKAYPLQWPPGWPKTPPSEKENGKFQSTLSGALNALRDEVRRLGGEGLVLSSNCTLDNSTPKESGVVAYFTYQKSQVAVPCDRWIKVESNVKAIALTIEAMRGMDRWGAKHMIKAMFQGFVALKDKGVRDWREVLGVNPEAADSKEAVHQCYKDLIRRHHPDNGGSVTASAEINDAWGEAKKEKGW